MAKIALHSDSPSSATSVSNVFIDEYMSDANGEFVKIYLYLLRLLNLPDASFSLSGIAEKFEHTEKDIRRALCYWERMQLLRLEYNADNDLTGVYLLGSQIPAAEAGEEEGKAELPAPAEKTYTPDEIRQFRENEAIAELFFITERYLGRPLSPTDVQRILFLYDGLHFSTDLIEYLVEACVGSGHKSMPYIYRTAFRWSENHITTVDEAKQVSAQFNRSYYTVVNAFGLSGAGRNLTPDELRYLKKWTAEYGFSDELIAEACRRTVEATSRPNFRYADSILSAWHKKEVRHLSDLAGIDAEHTKRSAARQAPAKHLSAKQAGASNKFNNFTQRTYDYDELEQMLLTQ